MADMTLLTSYDPPLIYMKSDTNIAVWEMRLLCYHDDVFINDRCGIQNTAEKQCSYKWKKPILKCKTLIVMFWWLMLLEDYLSYNSSVSLT